MSSIVYLTIDHVLALHERAITEEAGRAGVRSTHALAVAVGQAEQSAFGEDAYPTIPDKAAAYGYFLATRHAFIDGNKRTAAFTMETFLEVNGWTFDQTDEEMEAMFVSAANNVVDQGEFFGWVNNHARPDES